MALSKPEMTEFQIVINQGAGPCLHQVHLIGFQQRGSQETSKRLQGGGGGGRGQDQRLWVGLLRFRPWL